MRMSRSALLLPILAITACSTLPEPPAADRADVAATATSAPSQIAAPASADAGAPVVAATVPRAAPAVAPATPSPPPAGASLRKLDDFTRFAEPQGGAHVYRPLRRQGTLVGMFVGGYLHLALDGRRHTLAVEYPSGVYRGKDSQAQLRTGARLRPAYDPLKRCMSQRVQAQLTLSAGATTLAREVLDMSTECVAAKG